MGFMTDPVAEPEEPQGGAAPTRNWTPSDPVAAEATPPSRPFFDGSDAGPSISSGLIKGATGLADVLLTGGRGKSDPSSPEINLTPWTPASDVARNVLPEQMEYEPKSVFGGYLQTGAEFAPGMLFPAGKGGMLQRALYNVVAPAVTSETAGNVAKSFFPDNESAEAYARLLGGFMGGPLAGGVEAGIRAVRTPKNVDPLTATLQRNGIDLTAGNVRNDPRTLAFEATAPRTAGIIANQPVQFRNAALRRAGVAVPSEGEVVMDLVEAARKQAGRTYSQVTNGLDIVPSRLHVSRLGDIASTYTRNVESGLQTGTIGQIQQAIENSFRTGKPISPKQFGVWRSEISAATRSPSATARQSAIETLRVMDDVIGRSLAVAGKQDLIPLLGQARSTYRDVLAIEGALARAGKLGDEGMFRPTDLANALSSQGKEAFMRGRRGELADLAKAGRARLVPLEAIPPYKGSNLGKAARLATAAAAGFAGNYLGNKIFGTATPMNMTLAYGTGPALAAATEFGNRGLSAMNRNIFGSALMQEAMKRAAQNPASGASGLTGGVVGGMTGATGLQANGGRVERKAGGRVGIDHERLADQLVGAAERAKKGISKGTEQLLDLPDDHIAHALELANRSI